MKDNASLQRRKEAATPRGVGVMAPFFVARAENSELWDVEGRRYIDFAGGIAVLNTGHRHPKVIAAVKAQLDAFTHTCLPGGALRGYVELAERLNALAPGAFAEEDHVLLHRRRGDRERGEDRSRRHRPRRRHRVQRRLPRPHDHGAWRSPARSRRTRPASGRSRARSTTRRSRRAARRQRRRLAGGGRAALQGGHRGRAASPPSSSSRCRAKAASTSRRPSSCERCGSSATARHPADRRRGADRLRRAPASGSRWSTMDVAPDLIDDGQVAGRRLPALGRHRAAPR